MIQTCIIESVQEETEVNYLKGLQNRRNTKQPTVVPKKSWQVNLRTAETEIVLLSNKWRKLSNKSWKEQSLVHELWKWTFIRAPVKTPHTRERDKIKQTEASNKNKTKPRNFKQAPPLNTSQKQWNSVKLQLWTMTPTQRSGKLLYIKMPRWKISRSNQIWNCVVEKGE